MKDLLLKHVEDESNAVSLQTGPQQKLFTLNSVTRLGAITSNKPWVIYETLKVAFDWLDWEAILCLPHGSSFLGKIVGLMRIIYTGNGTCLWIEGGILELFKVQRGVQQGDPMTPDSFAAPLDKISESGVHFGMLGATIWKIFTDLIMQTKLHIWQ